MAFTHQRKKGDTPKPSADARLLETLLKKKVANTFQNLEEKNGKSSQTLSGSVWHCPRHPKLGLSPASISPTRAFAWKPPHGALYYLTPGAPTNCCFPPN